MTNLLLSPAQQEILLSGIWPKRVSKDPQNHSHLEQWDVRRTLIRIFGFGGWEDETLELTLVRELELPPGAIMQNKWVNGKKTQHPNERTLWTVVYRAQVRLTVYGVEGTSAHYDDGAIGKADNQPSVGDAHDQALKTALSQALKRCAMNLGDQFGLSLYNGGDLDPVVIRTLVGPAGEAKPTVELPRDEREVRPEPGAPAGGDDVDEHEPVATSRIEGGGGDRLDAAHPRRDHVQAAREQLDQLEGRNVAPQQAALDELAARRAQEASADEAYANRRRIPYEPSVNGHAAGQLPPPADDEPLHIAGARAVERARAAQREQRSQAQPQREPERPAPRKAPAGDPETAAFVEAIVHAQNAEQIARLWRASASVLPQGRNTDVRDYLETAIDDIATAAGILAPIFGEIKVKPSVAIPVGALVVAAGRHLDAEAMSLHDHIAAELAVIDPATGQAATPPADAVAPTR